MRCFLLLVNCTTVTEVAKRKITRTIAVLSPRNRAKPCKFRYVKSVRSFM